MLTNISVEGFKSIHQLQNLALGQVNVFVGANGSGKSNLLEAIGVLSAAASGISIDSESLGRRGVRLSPGELYKTNLKEIKKNRTVSFQVQGKWGEDIFDYKADLRTPDSHTDTWGFEGEEFRQNGKKLISLEDIPRSPKFFAVDNFGQALNPRLERALSRIFCQAILDSDSSRQVLLTTHNPLVLDGLNLRDERIRLFAVERNQNTKGASKITRVELSEKVLKQAETGTPLSQMWVMGLFGGVPDIF